ncbi:MAG: 6-phosphogluconolactonase, partial [Gammaproteobacteria bacterium]|nr:6-phosphogluconolactonase [Gammaproteobacteria bacterium]
MNQPDYIVDESKVALAEKLATDVAAMLAAGIRDRGRATIAVSGGSTPLPFFQALSRKPLDWSSVTVTLADERWVDPDHADSNERLVRQELLVAEASAATLLGLYQPIDEPEDALSSLDAQLRSLLPFDVVILGMGDDGHTASLFPGADGLQDALDLQRDVYCAAMVPGTAKHKRMSLTLKALVATQHLLVHITGETKRSVLEYALI